MEFNFYKDRIKEPDFTKEVWVTVLNSHFYTEVYFYYSEAIAKLAYDQIKRLYRNKDGIPDSILSIAKVSDGETIITDP